MSREIKFRAWHKECGAFLAEFMIGGDGVVYTEHKAFDDYYTETIPIDFSDVAIQQYTEIKDEGGVEIYEGDILRGSYGIPPVKVVGEVVYKGGSYYVNTPSHFPGECLLIDFPRFVCGVEVIGNIYENPELLEATNEQGND